MDIAIHRGATIIVAVLLAVLWLGPSGTPALAADVELSKDSTLEGILRRGELRIGLEVGYMPFEPKSPSPGRFAKTTPIFGSF